MMKGACRMISFAILYTDDCRNEYEMCLATDTIDEFQEKWLEQK